MNEKTSIFKIIVLAIGFVLLFTSVGNALHKLPSQLEKTSIDEIQDKINPLAAQTEIWSDDFNNASKIDPNPPGAGKSENYVVQNGEVTMQNTNPAWTDPAWTRMKPITLTNNVGQTLQDYRLCLTVPYDRDMQSDYEDIRFKHENSPTTWLDYWSEIKNPYYAIVWVRLPTIPTGSSDLYLFYGNPNASDASNYYAVFPTWHQNWPTDKKISIHADTEGAWDSDVAYGNDRFLVAWEEGEYPLPPWTYNYKQEIRGTIFDTDGNVIVNDFQIYGETGTEYRNENPSVAFGGNKFFVAWQRYINPTNVTTLDIKGRLVSATGGTEPVIAICSQPSVQADPNVAFDSVNSRFCVAWEDARNGTLDYNIYAKFYDTFGNQIGSEKVVCDAANTQSEPWIAFDPINQRYLIVWEEGVHPEDGPFDIYAGLFDKNLNLIGPGSGPSPIKLADGTTDTDYNFPCVAFNEENERYLVTWNDGDISDGDWWGNVWGVILDSSGAITSSTFQIKAGEFVRTSIAPYLNNLFLVSFDNNDKILGKLVSSDGDVFIDDLQLSNSSSAVADWADVAVGKNKIFITWEDTRETYPSPWNNNPDSFGNIWNLDAPEGSEVTYVYGSELKIILSAYVTSIAITPQDLALWDTFNAVFSGTIIFDILDGSSGSVLIHDVNPGENLSSLTASSVRLMASFTRANPSTTPVLDFWSISWLVNHPPNIPSNPNPSNGAINVDINADLSWTGGDPDPGDTVTYDVYFGTTSPPPKVVSNQSATTYDPGTLSYNITYHWRIVSWDSFDEKAVGPIWSFTTRQNNPPNIPSNPDPYDGETNVDINTNLSWTGGDPDPSDTVEYDIYFGTNPSPPLVQYGHPITTYDPGTLNYNTLYYWKIVARDNHGATSTGPTWSFTTTQNHDPHEPSNPSPANGATNVDVDTDLGWSGGDPDVDDLVTYHIYFGTTTPPDYYDSTPYYPATQTSITYDLPTLNQATTYYWRIEAEDDQGNTNIGPIWDFTTQSNSPPNTPYNPTPVNGATDIPVNTDLSWSGGDPDGDPVTYDVYFGLNSTPPLLSSNQTETTFDLNSLQYNTTYFWRIIAWDDQSASTIGPLWSFSTIMQSNTPPNIPTINGPIIAKPNTNLDYSVVTSDYDGDDIFYYIDWGDGTYTGWLGPFETSKTVVINHTWPQKIKLYIIRCKAKDVHGAQSDWGYLPVVVDIRDDPVPVVISPQPIPIKFRTTTPQTT